MTREEREFAKSRIEYLLKISSFVFDERDKEALEMAIKALSQEPCDDAISRREALKCLKGAWGDYSVLNEVFERIDKLPSVTPIRKTGHWIKKVDFGNCVHYVCSECKNEGEKDYCPSCGAEME